MKKLLTILGTLIWIIVILGGVVSYSITNNYNDLVAIAFVVIVPLLVFYRTKHSKTNNEANNNPQLNCTDNIKTTINPVIPLIQSPVVANPKFNRTERENELSFQFSQNHSDKINDYENKLYDAVGNIYEGTKNQQIKNCERAINIYDKFKNYCYKTKGGTIYFQDMWEYCHNSKNPCFSFIDDTNKHLYNLQNNIDDTYESFGISYDLAQQFENLLKNNSGIYQKDIYALLNSDKKSELRKYISYLCDINKIERIKSGNTYKLYLKSNIIIKFCLTVL